MRENARARFSCAAIGRVTVILITISALLAGIVPATTAATAPNAATVTTISDRAAVVELLKTGGRATKTAAEAALLGTDEQVREFLATGQQITIAHDNRLKVGQIMAVAGRRVREAAQAALTGTPADVRAFLETGWKEPQRQDLRVKVGEVMAANGSSTRLAGQKALEGTADDVLKFLAAGQLSPEITDRRKKVGEIMAVVVGDRVAATEPQTGLSGARAVTRVIVGEGVKQMVSVGVGGPRAGIIEATAHHPFWVIERGQWVDAQNILAGEHFQTVSGDHVVATGAVRHTEVIKVYNLTVDGIHTYYVLAGETTVLVHNTGCEPTGVNGGWESAADFTNPKTMNKKYDKHAEDFGVTGNRNNENLAKYEAAMREHMTAPDTEIYQFNYRGQGEAIGFIDPSSRIMVMLHADGTFWSGWKLGNQNGYDQLASIVDKGILR